MIDRPGTTDSLVGLRFELSGGVGKLSGQIAGKAGDLYLIQRDGADHFELLALEDLRAARFFPMDARLGGAANAGPSVPDARPPSTDPATASAQPRLSDRIRRSSSAHTSDE